MLKKKSGRNTNTYEGRSGGTRPAGPDEVGHENQNTPTRKPGVKMPAGGRLPLARTPLGGPFIARSKSPPGNKMPSILKGFPPFFGLFLAKNHDRMSVPFRPERFFGFFGKK